MNLFASLLLCTSCNFSLFPIVLYTVSYLENTEIKGPMPAKLVKKQKTFLSG